VLKPVPAHLAPAQAKRKTASIAKHQAEIDRLRHDIEVLEARYVVYCAKRDAGQAKAAS
jgi:hypothetical protein